MAICLLTCNVQAIGRRTTGIINLWISLANVHLYSILKSHIQGL